jgi:hypothetical protein
LGDSVDFETPDPWSLLTKAENRCKLGLISEALIAVDEAVGVALETYFDKQDTPLPAEREEALRIMRGEGVKISVQSVLRLDELRRRAERSADDKDITSTEVEEAISTAEKLLTEINEKQVRSPIRKRAAETSSLIDPPDLIKPLTPLHENIFHVEPEFVTKLLLARAILSTKRKRIPHQFGLIVTVLAVLACSFFGLLGGTGIIMTFASGSLFSIFGLIFDFVLLLIAYLFLKIALYVRGETR